MDRELRAKAAVLRQYEKYCYQVAFYLLQEEKLAVRSASEALLALGRDSCFFTETSRMRQILAKNAVIKSSLRNCGTDPPGLPKAAAIGASGTSKHT